MLRTVTFAKVNQVATVMSSVFYRHTRMQPPFAVGGDGPYIIDSEGRRYLDACGGAAVSCLGHDHPDVIAAIKRQLDAIPFAHSAFFTSAAAEELADLLVARSPGMARVYLVSGGSEAMEAALKLARRRRSSWRGSTFWSAVSRSAGISSPAARVTTATPWARWRSAATSGAGSSSSPS
jgi:adenosylmethionine-8-amino-7-oxononanoate aminotransferase